MENSSIHVYANRASIYAFMTHPETPLQQVVTDKSRLHWDIQYKNKPIRPHVPGHILRMEHPAEIRYSLHMG